MTALADCCTCLSSTHIYSHLLQGLDQHACLSVVQKHCQRQSSEGTENHQKRYPGHCCHSLAQQGCLPGQCPQPYCPRLLTGVQMTGCWGYPANPDTAEVSDIKTTVYACCTWLSSRSATSCSAVATNTVQCLFTCNGSVSNTGDSCSMHECLM